MRQRRAPDKGTTTWARRQRLPVRGYATRARGETALQARGSWRVESNGARAGRVYTMVMNTFIAGHLFSRFCHQQRHRQQHQKNRGTAIDVLTNLARAPALGLISSLKGLENSVSTPDQSSQVRTRDSNAWLPVRIRINLCREPRVGKASGRASRRSVL